MKTPRSIAEFLVAQPYAANAEYARVLGAAFITADDEIRRLKTMLASALNGWSDKQKPEEFATFIAEARRACQ